MKICFVGLELAPLDGKNVFIGGTANNIARLSKGLKKLGHEIYVLTSSVSLRFSGEISSPIGTFCTVPVYSPYASLRYGLEASTKLLYMLYQKGTQKKFDLINIHSGYSLMGLLGGLSSFYICLLYTSPSPRDLSTSRMPSSA